MGEDVFDPGSVDGDVVVVRLPGFVGLFELDAVIAIVFRQSLRELI